MTIYEAWYCCLCDTPVHFEVRPGYEYNDWVAIFQCDARCSNHGGIAHDNDLMRRLLFEVEGPLRPMGRDSDGQSE